MTDVVREVMRLAAEQIDRSIVSPYLMSQGIDPATSGIEWSIRIRVIEALVPAILARSDRLR